MVALSVTNMARAPSRPPDERVRALLRGQFSARGSSWGADARPDDADPAPDDPVGRAGEVIPGPALREWARQAGLKPLDVPGPLRAARLRFGPRQFAALLLVVAIAALVLVVRVIGARSSAQIRPMSGPAVGGSVATGTAVAGKSLVSGTAGAGMLATPVVSGTAGNVPGAAGPTGAGQVFVHVVGQVKYPGVVSVPTGSRVLAAVQAAGGPSPTAVLNRLNLARFVVDGEQIVVPGAGDPVAPAGSPGAAGAGAAGSVPGAGKPSAGPVNLNTATVAELDALPGIGPVLAARIVAWREEHGRFNSIDELGEVSGIGDKLFARLRPAVSVS